MAAKRHGIPTVAVIVATPLPLCLERLGPRPANWRVPEDTVRFQHQTKVASHQRLAAEGFNTVVFADALHRLEPFLERLSQVREADLGRDGSEGLGVAGHDVGDRDQRPCNQGASTDSGRVACRPCRVLSQTRWGLSVTPSAP
ncbi:ATP-binding protein [Streptomyces griseofuscus]|uniref:hypothetical protein n=1 Tax=Streptomyces griseofuscus TaxID=146922 RepID=UPI0038173A38